jgi:hypothetical protein
MGRCYTPILKRSKSKMARDKRPHFSHMALAEGSLSGTFSIAVRFEFNTDSHPSTIPGTAGDYLVDPEKPSSRQQAGQSPEVFDQFPDF